MRMTRKLGKSGIEVSAVGLGCWPIGGSWQGGGKMYTMGNVNDEESLKAVERAIDLGINFFDTADVYGSGNSETIIGKAIKGKRDRAVIASKFGHVFDEKTKEHLGKTDATPAYIRKACENSLRRLGTDYIDLYQCHIWSLPLDEAEIAFITLDSLKQEGKIREYGWSTDHPDCINFLVNNTNAVSIQHQFNVFINADGILKTCEKYNLASINRSPLGMGLLSGKFNKDSKFNPEDLRGQNIDWMIYFKEGKPNCELLDKLNSAKDILTSNGRNLVQGAIGWLWAKSDKTIPIPGFTKIKQVEEIAKSMEFGPLTKDQMDEIDKLFTKVSYDGTPVYGDRA
jgi:aryl-alcohol dehydrogenase-like predicted oxidoreductase